MAECSKQERSSGGCSVAEPVHGRQKQAEAGGEGCVWRVYDVVYFIALASCKSSLVPCVQLVLWHDHIVRTKRWLLISAPLVTPTTTPPFLPIGAPECQKSWWGPNLHKIFSSLYIWQSELLISSFSVNNIAWINVSVHYIVKEPAFYETKLL